MKAYVRIRELRAVLDLAAARRNDVPALQVRRWWQELGVVEEELHHMSTAFEQVVRVHAALMLVERRLALGRLPRRELHSLRKLVGPLRRRLMEVVENGRVVVMQR